MSGEDVKEQFLAALRGWGALFGEMGRQFGVHAGMHGTDASALVHIINAEQHDRPLTQSELCRRIGLSSGATSSLLNRLESAGHVERRRDQADRRVVTLRSSPAVHEEVDNFFRAVADDLDKVIRAHLESDLREFTQILEEMSDSLERHLLFPLRSERGTRE